MIIYAYIIPIYYIFVNPLYIYTYIYPYTVYVCICLFLVLSLSLQLARLLYSALQVSHSLSLRDLAAGSTGTWLLGLLGCDLSWIIAAVSVSGLKIVKGCYIRISVVGLYNDWTCQIYNDEETLVCTHVFVMSILWRLRLGHWTEVLSFNGKVPICFRRGESMFRASPALSTMWRMRLLGTVEWIQIVQVVGEPKVFWWGNSLHHGVVLGGNPLKNLPYLRFVVDYCTILYLSTSSPDTILMGSIYGSLRHIYCIYYGIHGIHAQYLQCVSTKFNTCKMEPGRKFVQRCLMMLVYWTRDWDRA